MIVRPYLNTKYTKSRLSLRIKKKITIETVWEKAMKMVTTHQAKTHLSRLLKEVQAGETIVILNGNVPVAQLIAVESAAKKRPKVGTHTSAPVHYAEDAFSPLQDGELEGWGV